MHEASRLLGLDNVSGPFYAFWSGIGLTVCWPVVFWVKHNCHQPKCWKIGKHTINGSPYCSKHGAK